jgi:hypothetical protein
MREYILQTKNIYVGAIVIDSDALLKALWKVDHAIKISAIRVGVDATCTKADTNYNSLAVRNAAVDVANIANGPNTSAGTTFTLGTFADMVVVTAAGANILAAGDTLSLKVTKTGNGLAMAGVNLQIEYYDYNA